MPPKDTLTDIAKRWAPLVGSLALAAATVARVMGYDILAERIVGDVLKLAAAGLVTYGAGRKLQSQARKRQDRKRAGRLWDLE